MSADQAISSRPKAPRAAASLRAHRPLIGVAASAVRRHGNAAPVPEAEPSRQEMAIGLGYLRAIEQAGGLPMVMPPLKLDAIEPLLRQLSGLCLPGGPDVSPRTYGAASHPSLGPTEPALDGFELAVARLADMAGLPVLAIGRGMQVLNVARGGTLHQHIPEISREVEHRQPEPGDSTSHGVEVEPSSELSAIVGSTRLAVNSFHHQCVDQIGEALAAVARAPDGTIEAIEAKDREFLLGVQWNAELLADRAPHSLIFERFVDACEAAES